MYNLIAFACKTWKNKNRHYLLPAVVMEDTDRPQQSGLQNITKLLQTLFRAYALKIGGKDRNPPLKIAARSQLFSSLVSLVGALIGIIIIGLITSYFLLPLLIAPLAASAVLLFSVYDSPLAQPRNAILGHLLSALIGSVTSIVYFFYFADGGSNDRYIWIAISVATSIFAMRILHLTHPPAGATAFLASTAIKDLNSFVLFLMPVTVGILILVAVAIIFNNAIPKRRYPVYW
jgi:CBS-domain-containing membrane protein